MNTAIYSPSGSNAGIGFAIPVDGSTGWCRNYPQRPRADPGHRHRRRQRVRRHAAWRRGRDRGAHGPGLTGRGRAARDRDGEQELGDVIVGVDGKPVRRLADLTDQLERAGVGKTVQLALNRNGAKTTVAVEVADVSPR